jgi:hypothetical protein
MKEVEVNAKPIAEEIENEFYRAIQRFPAMASGHEGWAILREEVDELWEEVKHNKRPPDQYIRSMRKEAIQVAAMAMRFVIDVCDSGHISQDVTLLW